ncbi:hypothetical protein DPSP01_000452 [Paraphaeosphaeria sporulosa]
MTSPNTHANWSMSDTSAPQPAEAMRGSNQTGDMKLVQKLAYISICSLGLSRLNGKNLRTWDCRVCDTSHMLFQHKFSSELYTLSAAKMPQKVDGHGRSKETPCHGRKRLRHVSVSQAIRLQWIRQERLGSKVGLGGHQEARIEGKEFFRGLRNGQCRPRKEVVVGGESVGEVYEEDWPGSDKGRRGRLFEFARSLDKCKGYDIFVGGGVCDF